MPFPSAELFRVFGHLLKELKLGKSHPNSRLVVAPDFNEDDPDHPDMVLIYVPNKRRVESYHISVPHQTVIELHEWTKDYLERFKR
jgi:hypothetical protein